MEKLPTAEEFFKIKKCRVFSNGEVRDIVIPDILEFTKMHVEAALKEVNKNAKVSLGKDWVRKEETIYPGQLIAPITTKVDEDSILNSYSLENIK
jgi:hypothetical protein